MTCQRYDIRRQTGRVSSGNGVGMRNVTVVEAERPDEAFVANVFEKYLYEMSPFMDREMDDDGLYALPFVGWYFAANARENGRSAHLILVDGKRAGFALVNRVSPYDMLDESARPDGYVPSDWSLAEFTVFPTYRGHGIARRAAETLLGGRSGTWELMFDDRNTPAASLWRQLCHDYGGTIRTVGRYSRVARIVI